MQLFLLVSTKPVEKTKQKNTFFSFNVLTFRFAGEVDFHILVSSIAWVTKDAVGSRHTAGGTSLTPSSDHTQGVGASAVGIGHGAVLAVSCAQSPVVGRDNINVLPRSTAQVQRIPFTCSNSS